MTKDEFLALPPDERKRLASLRSREIARARKAGQPIPPTLGEEFGDKKKKAAPVIAPAPVAAPAEPAKPRVKPEPGVKNWVLGTTVVPCGMGESPLRTMRGMLHWTPSGTLADYEKGAKERGFNKKITYKDGDKVVGIFFFKGEFPGDKVRAILIGSHPTTRFQFGKAEAV